MHCKRSKLLLNFTHCNTLKALLTLIILFFLTGCQDSLEPDSSTPVDENTEALTTNSTEINQDQPIETQGTLPWLEKVLFLLAEEQKLSWLFTLESRDSVTFRLRGFGPQANLHTTIKRWNIEDASWEEVSWLESRSNAQQDLILERELEEGYYWLVISGDLGEEPQPFELMASCQSQQCAQTSLRFAPENLQNDPVPTSDEDPAVGFTLHFSQWLEANGYAEENFARPSLAGSSYGGKVLQEDQITRDPVIFIHGNSDRAMGGELGGWQKSIQHFKEAGGYNSSEMYAITWGDANTAQASEQYHSYENIMRLRKFIEAVLDYTGAEKVDIISHSMGVTLARRALLGGEETDNLGQLIYDIGPALGDRVDAFVGIAGANRGLLACGWVGQTVPTCGMTHGLYPGMYWGRAGRSDLLKTLDTEEGYEGDFVASIWSPQDELINVVGEGSLIWGEPTSRIPGQDMEFVLEDATHLESRDLSIEAQLSLIEKHQLP